VRNSQSVRQQESVMMRQELFSKLNLHVLCTSLHGRAHYTQTSSI